MPQYDHQRSGEDRRSDNGHCPNHEKNTTDIAANKASHSTLRWVIGISLPVLVVLAGWAHLQSTDTLKSIQADVKAVQATINTGATADATTRIEIEQIKADIRDLKERVRR